jgi:protein-S-isoprenylcysteine O-methyltransferase Ste14
VEPFYLVALIVFLAGVVLMVFEGRIMRKRESERSDRQRKFLAWSRKAGAGYSKVGMKVFPVVLIVLGVAMGLLSIPMLAGGESIGWFLVGMGVSAVVLGIAFLVFAKKRRGPDFWAKHEAANREADQQGRVRWFGSPRAAIVLGVLLLVGAVFASMWLIPGSRDVPMGWAYLVLLVGTGALCLQAGVRQLRQER